jgi:Protein of unknown function (DUF1559)/BlaR1 peptidase M56
MNELGAILLAGAARCLALAAVGAALCLFIRRRGPANGATAALATLTGLAFMVMLAGSPWPRWWELRTPELPHLAKQLARPGPSLEPPPAIETRSTTNVSASIHPETPIPVGGGIVSVALVQGFLQALQRPVDGGDVRWSWAAWVAAAYLVGVGAMFARLLLGLWGVGLVRRKARPIVDAGVQGLIKNLRFELGVSRETRAYESEQVGTPATVGWRSPAVLLPIDWRDWSESERRAVLAHELAHVRRGDYAAGIWARACLALNFYQPLAYWLSGRLRLEQELAADAWGARLSGGNASYLQTLARLALRRDQRATAWPARAFLPTRGTLTRRIEMLRDAKAVDVLTPRRRSLALTIVALGVAGLALAGVRGPAGSAAALARQTPSPKAKAGSEAFDLSLVPPDAGMIIVARPASLLAKPEFGALDALIGPNGDLTKHLGVRPDQVEQVVLIWLRTVAPNRANVTLPPPSVIVVRTTAAHELKAITDDLVAKRPQEATHLGETYTRTADANDGAAYYRPDDRTLVIGTRESALKQYFSSRLIRSQGHAWDDAMAALGGGQIGMAIDSAFLAQALGPVLSQPNAAAQLEMFSPLWVNAHAHALVLNGTKGVSLEYAGACNSDEGTGQVTKTVEAMLTLAQNALPGLRRAAPEGAPPIAELIAMAEDGLRSAKVERDGRIVRLRASANRELVATVKNIVAPSVQASRSAARRTQSMNNLRQLALAIHNYAAAHDNKFPPAVVIGPDGKTPHSWRVELLPYLEQDALYNRYKMDEPWDSPANREVLNARPALFAFPGADINATDACYFVLRGPQTIFAKDGQGMSFNEISDGLSNTILFVEAKRSIPWTKPEDIPAEPGKPVPKLGGFQIESAGFNAAIADGSVRFIKDSINPDMLRALSTRAGGEVIAAPF